MSGVNDRFTVDEVIGTLEKELDSNDYGGAIEIETWLVFDILYYLRSLKIEQKYAEKLFKLVDKLMNQLK